MTPPRPLELVRLAAEHLAGRGVENPRLEAELLLAHVLGIKRLDLYLQFERPLEPGEVDAYRDLTRRRASREPLQYIVGETGFRELTLRVDARVLVPRPETEVLVENVLRWAHQAGLDDAEALDLGTGSGAIALSLLREGPFARVVATDRSSDALEVAAANAESAGLDQGLELRCGDLWEAVGPGEEFEVIVANPPYVAQGDRESLAPEVRDHEPAAALFAGPDGLAVIRRLAHGAGAHLASGGLLALEVGLGQAAEVAALLREAGFTNPQTAKDLTDRERVVLAVYD